MFFSQIQTSYTFQCSQGGSSALLQTELDLSDLLHPDTFLGALRQLASRLYGVPMDELRLDNTWARGGGSSRAKASIRVAGMLLEGGSFKNNFKNKYFKNKVLVLLYYYPPPPPIGATFDGSRLSPSSHDSPPFAPAPPCWMAWVPKQESSAANQAADSIALPLYLSGERERVVAHLQVI